MIDYIDSNSDHLKSEDDLPISDVNIITFLIKVVLDEDSHLVLLSLHSDAVAERG